VPSGNSMICRPCRNCQAICSAMEAVCPASPLRPDVLKAMRDADQLMQAARASRDEIAAERARTARRQEAA